MTAALPRQRDDQDDDGGGQDGGRDRTDQRQSAVVERLVEEVANRRA
jgi:hypothetical protein